MLEHQGGFLFATPLENKFSMLHSVVFHSIDKFHMFFTLSKRIMTIFAKILMDFGEFLSQNDQKFNFLKIELHTCYVPQKKAKII